MKRLWEGLRGLGATRLAALGGVGAATFALLLFLGLHLSAPAPMALLYADLDLHDASQMADALDKAHIAHTASPDGTTLMVPYDRVAEARLTLARGGLPNGGSIGYEIFDRGDELTASQFQQNINQTRALEGELTRSIRMISGVRAVRVHLVLAQREAFAQDQQEAQASVLLTMNGSARMDREGVQAVLNLVAAAVPSLKPQNIAIIDNHGEVLSRAGQPTDGVGAAGTADELRHTAETRLAHDVEDMLARSLGEGHVRAEASVDMDFDHSSETDEQFDPNGQVARSTQTVTDKSKSTEKNDTVTVANNLPNPDAGAGNAGSNNERNEETTNYEIGKTTRVVQHDQPRIRRISLAVMVDGTNVTGADGKIRWQERPAADLQRIQTLARSVIGYDEKRGDTVNVVSMQFAPLDDGAAVAAPGALLGFDHADAMRMLQLGLVAVLGLVALLTVLRPAALRLTAAPPGAVALAGGQGIVEGELLPAGQQPAGLLTDETMTSMQSMEGQIRASLLRRITILTEQHPAESLAIVRGWMAQDAT